MQNPMLNLRSEAAKKAWETRRSARYRASKSEKASKVALASWCQANGWKVLFFEGRAVLREQASWTRSSARIKPGDADAIEIRLVQLKGGAGGLTAHEIARLKQALTNLSKDWLLAAFDGQMLHLLPDIPRPGGRRAA